MRIGLGLGLGAASAAQWTPQQIGASRFLWLRADAADLTLSGAKVTAWVDKGGGSYSQATDAKRPTAVSSAINGRPGVQFGASILLSRTLTLAAGDWLIVSALSVPATGVNSYLYGTPTRVVADTDGNDGTQVSYYDGAWKKAGAAATGAQILSWDLRAAGANIYRDGTVLSGGPLAYTAMSLTDPSIGFDGAAGTQSTICEIVGVDTDGMVAADVDALRTRLQRYMGSRYGITVA